MLNVKIMKQLNFVNSFTAHNQYQILLWKQIVIKLIIKSTAQRQIKETGVYMSSTPISVRRIYLIVNLLSTDINLT